MENPHMPKRGAFALGLTALALVLLLNFQTPSLSPASATGPGTGGTGGGTGSTRTGGTSNGGTSNGGTSNGNGGTSGGGNGTSGGSNGTGPTATTAGERTVNGPVVGTRRSKAPAPDARPSRTRRGRAPPGPRRARDGDDCLDRRAPAVHHGVLAGRGHCLVPRRRPAVQPLARGQRGHARRDRRAGVRGCEPGRPCRVHAGRCAPGRDRRLLRRSRSPVGRATGPDGRHQGLGR